MPDTSYDPNNGSITDSDDHVWVGDVSKLSGGEWRHLGTTSKLRQRGRTVLPTRHIGAAANHDDIHTQSSSPARDSTTGLDEIDSQVGHALAIDREKGDSEQEEIGDCTVTLYKRADEF